MPYKDLPFGRQVGAKGGQIPKRFLMALGNNRLRFVLGSDTFFSRNSGQYAQGQREWDAIFSLSLIRLLSCWEYIPDCTTSTTYQGTLVKAMNVLPISVPFNGGHLIRQAQLPQPINYPSKCRFPQES